MQPINLLIYIWAAVVLIPVFLFLPYISKYREPFGYKTYEPIEDDQFRVIKKDYTKKVLIFSLPFSAVIILVYLIIQNTSFSTLLLGLMLLGLVCINLIFYMQAYAKVREYFTLKKEAEKTGIDQAEGKNKIEIW